MRITFTILLPTYKSRFLRECIDSIVAQTYPDWELLVVDDASPDPIEAVVKTYDDARIRYYRNAQNYGARHLVDQWNHCLSLATGAYVICMGDDDLLLPHCLETYAELIGQYPDIALLHGQTQIIDEKGNVVKQLMPRPERESAITMLYHRTFSRRAQFIGDFCYLRSALVAQGGFYKLPYAWGSDDITALQAAGQQGIVNTQEVVFAYRDNAGSITRHAHIAGKLHAVWLEAWWKWQFLHRPAANEQDEQYRRLLKRHLLSHTLRKCYYILRNV